MHFSKSRIFPWISIELEKDNQKRNLNISFERLETNHFQDYHRLHISVTDVPVCQKGDFRDFPYDRKFPPVFLDIHLDVIDVKTFCKVIENSEADEYIKDESIIVFILANEKVLVLYPHFCGSFVTTGMISARIVSTDELDEVLKQIMGFSEPV